MKKILFVCSENRLRSPTAETVFSDHQDMEVASAGINPTAVTPVSAYLIEWSDIIIAMVKSHEKLIFRHYGELVKDKRLAVLHIPDVYEYMNPELIKILKAKVPGCFDYKTPRFFIDWKIIDRLFHECP